MATVQRFEDLEVWKTSRVLCKYIYNITLNERFSKDFTLKDQIKRSSGSTMDNIAEGFGRCGSQEFVQYLSITNGSASEVKSQLYRALDTKYISDAEFDEGCKIISELINKTMNFINYLNKTNIKGEKYKYRKK